MKKVYILDESISSKRNGIGTYTRHLVKILKSVVKITIISFNSETKEFDIMNNNDIIQMKFPVFPDGSYLSNGDIISIIFKIYIEDSEDNIFIASHSPCSKFLFYIKKNLPLSKIVFVIHDFGWTYDLSGNLELYKKIIRFERKHNGKNKYSYIIDRYKEEKKIYDLSDRIICLCHNTFNLLNDLYKIDRNKLILISNGLKQSKKGNKDMIRKEFYLNEDEKILLFTGRLVLNKGIDILFSAFERVLLQNPKVRLVIAGLLTPNIEKLFSLYPRMVNKITVTGFLPKEVLQKWYSVADIGVIPSYYEQCSYTGIEMMMNGLPIVTTNGYGLNDMFKNREDAYVIDIKDCKSKNKSNTINLSNAIIEMLNSRELCEALGKKAYETYKNRYQLKYMRKGYVELINGM